ncbi:MAG: arginase [Rhodobacteraceae bacterium HLUCCA12]|nr:MAG: arginase [Rhodobacteraceae bacterium HLUCCA12]
MSHASRHCVLIGAPVDSGQRRPGCLMGPAAYRVAGIAAMLQSLGHGVSDQGDFAPAPVQPVPQCPNPAVHSLGETLGWTQALAEAGQNAITEGGLPIFLGGDHSLSLGSLAGMAAHAAKAGRPLFVLWLDAHSDFHTPETTESGNLHGTPIAYATGRPFAPFPPFPAPVAANDICLFGLRSVDPAEHAALLAHDIALHDMRTIDEHGVSAPLRAFLDRVAAAGGLLHVSLDVDFLDPAIAPAVGTTVPGGATFREAHLVMEMLHDSGLVTSIDLVELNPFLDERGRTAHLMVDLLASLMGRKVFDRPTRSYRGQG